VISMTGTDRLTSEKEFHDRQAADRASTFRADADRLRFDDADYLDHETWVRPAFERLGLLRGKRVLDYGCGHGMAAVVLARAGAAVTAFDLSPGYVAETLERAASNGVSLEALAADAEHLPFDDKSFDAVWGNAILHHLDLNRAGAELKRVLKPNGVAVFCEPWGGNPLLALARRFLPYPGKARTPDEQPLRKRDLAPLKVHFPNLTVEGFQLFGMVRRVVKVNWFDGLDARLPRPMPGLGNWCRYVVLTLPNG